MAQIGGRGSRLLEGDESVLQAVEWSQAHRPGDTMTVRFSIGRERMVYVIDPISCYHPSPPNNYGFKARVDAIVKETDEILASETVCVGEEPEEFAFHEFDVTLPTTPGEYTVRLLFMEGTDVGGAFPLFDTAHEGHYSEVWLPVSVVESGEGRCTAGDCAPGMQCVDGTCVPDSSVPPGNGGDGSASAGTALVGLGAAYLYLRERGGL